jgi:hypothetical protein
MRKYFLQLNIVLLTAILCSCSKSSNESGNNLAATTGKGGSLARFTIVGNFLYLVDDLSLDVIDVSNPSAPVQHNSVALRWGVETIFPYKNNLFIGSTDGMYIFSLTDPTAPVLLGEARHTRSCDPVVANDSVAFVTLRGDQPCGPAEDGLYIYDIKNLFSPTLINTKLISTPHGLGLQDSILYVCRKNNGMNIYNVSNPSAPVLRNQISNYNFEDVICYNNLLICYVSDGLVLYNIDTPSQPVFLSVVQN